MIEKTNFRATQKREEIFSENSQTASLRCLYADADSIIGDAFPWHWHTAFEIDYIEGCDTQFDFSGTSLLVPHGSAIFINSGEIHSYRPKVPMQCRIYAFLFAPTILAGSCGDPIYTQYVAPIVGSNLTFLSISSDSGQDAAMLSDIRKMISLASEEPDYYEITLRSTLGSFWCDLMDRLKSQSGFFRSGSRDRERIRQMLNFIHSNYSVPLSLQEIAASAAIGARECSRCFQRCIRRSPMEYLNDFRIQMAMQQLAAADKSITEISECCGFSSISYFGKVFKQHTGQTPLQYRLSCMGQKP